MMDKTKLNDAVDESLVEQKIHKSDVLAHNM